MCGRQVEGSRVNRWEIAAPLSVTMKSFGDPDSGKMSIASQDVNAMLNGDCSKDPCAEDEEIADRRIA